MIDGVMLLKLFKLRLIDFDKKNMGNTFEKPIAMLGLEASNLVMHSNERK